MSSQCARKKPNKKYRQRLFIGEGDFSYVEALLNKHIDKHKPLAQAIVATELTTVPELDVEPEIMEERAKRIESLRERGVKILFGIDGTKLHENPIFKGERFKRVHWNCPWRVSTVSERDFVQVIVEFFESCGKIQLKGDRIHVTLTQGLIDDDWHYLRQYEHNLVKASVRAGYKLIRKRRSGRPRYPGYKHRKGDDLVELYLPAQHREFVFEKDPSCPSLKTETEILESLPIKITNSEKTYCIDINKKNVTDKSKITLEECYFVCSTDDDSSDYCSSDE
ncbi:uncharacterized protein LOC135846521 [Planococcus citri]|uniref:uncharacterized protein LOC135846521 n=1 Tax=Planococcus citri TaxID=170843 RepID=UPI0031F937C8